MINGFCWQEPKEERETYNGLSSDRNTNKRHINKEEIDIKMSKQTKINKIDEKEVALILKSLNNN